MGGNRNNRGSRRGGNNNNNNNNRGGGQGGGYNNFNNAVYNAAPSNNNNGRQGQNSGRVCPHFLRGQCRFGPQCKDLHTTNGANNRGGGQNNNMGGANNRGGGQNNNMGGQQQNSGRVCKHFLRGQCRFGPQCKDLHTTNGANNRGGGQNNMGGAYQPRQLNYGAANNNQQQMNVGGGLYGPIGVQNNNNQRGMNNNNNNNNRGGQQQPGQRRDTRPVCQHFLRGHCAYGNRCVNSHDTRGGGGAGAGNDQMGGSKKGGKGGRGGRGPSEADEVQTVMMELGGAAVTPLGQKPIPQVPWPLVTFGLDGEPSVLTGTDMSYEEIRMHAYQCGDMNIHTQAVAQLVQDATALRQAVLADATSALRLARGLDPATGQLSSDMSRVVSMQSMQTLPMGGGPADPRQPGPPAGGLLDDLLVGGGADMLGPSDGGGMGVDDGIGAPAAPGVVGAPGQPLQRPTNAPVDQGRVTRLSTSQNLTRPGAAPAPANPAGPAAALPKPGSAAAPPQSDAGSAREQAQLALEQFTAEEFAIGGIPEIAPPADFCYPPA